jgi:hypothetical protein
VDLTERPWPGRFFYPGPALVDPLLDGLVVPLHRFAGRPLPAPAHVAENSPDVAGVVLHPGGLLDHLGHPGERPQFGGIPVGLRTLLQGPLHLGQVRCTHLGRATGLARALQRPLPSDLPLLVPVGDGLMGDLQLTADGRLGDPLGEEVGRPHATGFHGREVPSETGLGIRLRGDRSGWGRGWSGHAQLFHSMHP